MAESDPLKEPSLRPESSGEASREPVPPIASDALRINLQRTALPVAIPEDQRILLDIVKDKLGIHKQTEELLRETNHPYANWDDLVEPVRSRALGDFYDHNKHEQGPEAFTLLFGLLIQCMDKCRQQARRKRAFFSLLDYLELLFLESGSKAARNHQVTEKIVSRLGSWLEKEPGLAARGTTKLKKLVRKILSSADSVPLESLTRLYLFSLENSINSWLEQENLAPWFRAHRETLFDNRDYEGLFLPVSSESFRDLREKLNRVAQETDHEPTFVLSQLVSIPDFSQLEQACLNIAHEMEREEDPNSILHKLHYLTHLLELPTLTEQNETILRELGRCLERIRDREAPVWVDLLQRLFALLHEKKDRYVSAVLDCVYTVGKEVFRLPNPDILFRFIDETIALGFQHPNRKGVNQDWQVVVNPYHLKNIRHWFSLIQMHPGRSRKLISALIINLKLGGLFINDTDLFQKDISLLLGSDIRDCFGLTKTLARLFPVYFHEIGAEGELRDISTSVDELYGRHDLLVHFLRKQCHVESNNQIVAFMEQIIAYWQTGKKELVANFLPPEIYEQIAEPDSFQEEMRPIFLKLLEQGRLRPRDLVALPAREILGSVQGVRQVPEHARRKAELFVQLYRLLVKKYTINHHDVLRDLRQSNLFPSMLLEKLEDTLEKSDHQKALEVLLSGLLPLLRENIFSEGDTQPREEIYRKRHIAVGIPSMYGRYEEKRFDSLGLTFRLESLAEVLFNELTLNLNLEYITRSTLERVHAFLRLFAEALKGEGIVIENLLSNLDLLKHALSTGAFSVEQYLNLFQFLANTVKEIIQTQYIAVHEENLKTIITTLLKGGHPLPFNPPEGGSEEEVFYQASEWFTRDLLANSFAIQELDLFIGKVLAGLAKESRSLDRHTRTLLLSYDLEKCFTPFLALDPRLDTQIYLGSKGYFLKRMNAFGYPVPPGFVVTTEFFRCREAIQAYTAAKEDFFQRLRLEIKRLETRSGRRFGDPKNPLLLSVRSGSTISMPGMLSTFLNIGINDTIAATLAGNQRFEWAAWDNYRRFLQCWGMSFGIPRDRFDDLIHETKRIYSAAYKRELLPDQMRDLAFAYRKLLEKESVYMPLDPWEQLRTAIDQVLASWYSDTARLYRQVMKIAEEWGTAVIIQQMVFGNLDSESGTGVVFTRNPRKPASAFTLFGDFTICAQGEDVVSGLVETSPVSEDQRLGESLRAETSMEREFPRIYQHLARLAEELILKRGFQHQEIEFTFENKNPNSLYILQARDIVPPEDKKTEVFLPTPQLQSSQVGTGIGAGGGALSGIAVHRHQEIEEFRRKAPGSPLILLRPDTVPDDIEMILKVDGVLTARGGSTSHAAVTAYRLGKTCVVGCRELQVKEKQGRSTIQDLVIESGDWIAIDGHNGSIHKGRHDTTTTYGRMMPSG